MFVYESNVVISVPDEGGGMWSRSMGGSFEDAGKVPWRVAGENVSMISSYRVSSSFDMATIRVR